MLKESMSSNEKETMAFILSFIDKIKQLTMDDIQIYGI